MNKRYIEVFLIQICYLDEIKKGNNGKVKLSKDTKLKKRTILQNYRSLMPSFELLNQAKE